MSEHPARTSLTAFAPYDPRRAPLRLLIAVCLGVAAGFFVPARLGLAERVVAGWDAGATVYLALVFVILRQTDAHMTQRRAASIDPGRTAVWLLVSLSSTVALFAATVVLRRAHRLGVANETVLVSLSLAAVVCAWALTHTSYTLRYAHLYYRERDGVGGLEFPGGSAPSYADFAYFAFTVGMCFQVSDVTVSNTNIRRAVLSHALLSFAYNTAIVALSLNLLSGLLG